MKKGIKSITCMYENMVISCGESGADNTLFRLHNHDDYEIYLFISGDAEYHIEGRKYRLHPYDILFVRPDEMHRIYHNSENCIYKRIIININDDFFEKFHIGTYKEILIERTMSKDRKIQGSTVIESGMRDIFEKIHRLMDKQDVHSNEAVIQALTVQLLYTMCDVNFFGRQSVSDSKIQNAIDYINDRFTEDITLDDISKNTFVSKHHLCRIFKQTTGYTVGEYINHKRLMQVNHLCKTRGMSLKEACDMSGFPNYSTFYRIYKKENGISPREGMR